VDNERLIHDMMLDYLVKKFSKEYREIKVNPSGDPDLVLGNHGLVLACMEIETEGTITAEKAAKWKETAQSGAKLILMVPRHSKVKVMELLWQNGLADKVGVGSYEIQVQMP
jgi:hypothetical protein